MNFLKNGFKKIFILPYSFISNAGLKFNLLQQCRHQNLITTGSNLRQVLGSILYLIRFSSMSVEDLCEAGQFFLLLLL